MAGKSSKLAVGVNRTGNGLFRGMTAINAAKAEEKVESKKTVETVKVEKKPEKIDVQEQENVVEETKTVNKIEENRVLESDRKLHEELQSDDIDIQSEESTLQLEAEQSEEITESAEEEADLEAASEVEETPIPEPIKVIKEEIQIKEEKVVSPEPVKAAETAAPKGKGTSRYEKEKFLLLDVRGYRDYVEHMAKAANMSATKYIRNLIQQDMDKNMDIYEAHKLLEEKLRGRSLK